MTLNELKVICIKFTSMDEQVGLSTETYEDYKSTPEYLAFTNNVLEAINRATQRIVDKRKSAIKTLEVAHTFEEDNTKINKKIELSSYNDIEEIIKIDFEREDTYEIQPISEYRKYNDTIVLEYENVSGKYLIKYFSNIREVTEADNNVNLATIGLPNKLCTIVEYYVKSELWEREQPELALKYKDIAETYLEDIRNYDTDEYHQDNIKSVYKM